MTLPLRTPVPALTLLLTLALLAPASSACTGVPDAPRATVAEPASPAPAATPPAAPSAPLAAGAAAAPVRLAFGPQTGSTIEFVGAKLTATHAGSFARFSGTLDLVADHLEQSHVSVEIELDSLQIEPPRLAGHLRTADFFDVARYPRATFSSSAITAGAAGGATHTIAGTLALHGVSKRISFPATLTVSPAEVGARAAFILDRRDFHLVYPGMPDDLIKDDVTIELTVRAPRP